MVGEADSALEILASTRSTNIDTLVCKIGMGADCVAGLECTEGTGEQCLNADGTLKAVTSKVDSIPPPKEKATKETVQALPAETAPTVVGPPPRPIPPPTEIKTE